jgi:uncharacterized coiled-coil protein SlyX
MNLRRTNQILFLAFAVTFQSIAADGPETQSAQPASTGKQEIDQLKSQLAEQQKQIEDLRLALQEQRKMIQAATKSATPAPAPVTPTAPPSGIARLGEVASTTPVIPPAAPPVLSPTIAGNGQGSDNVAAPLQIHIGSSTITPVGFMDMTSISRSTNPGTGIGTNFGSIPYGNTQAGSLTETRLSVQNSRIGARFDGGFGDFKVIGYWESDFLGQLGNPPNGGLAVSSNPYVFRLRLFWADVSKGNWEFLAGQSWSLLTPGRAGISPLPGNLFYSQDIDVNYQAGLVWGRIPGFRGTYHFGDKAAFAVALENSEPYVGGGNGGSAIVAPAALAAASGFIGTQINNGGSVISSAALHPDIIAKFAVDPSSKFHFEVAGVEITNKIANPTSVPAYQTNTKAGGGFAVNLNVELFKGFRLFTNNFWSDGAGRYIFGQAPDFILGANGDISLVHSLSTVTGFEATARKTLFYAYYGGVYISKNLAVDTTGKLVGYGPISSDGQNRTIQEITFGSNTTLAKDPRWGALNLMFQFSYLQRNPWLAAGTAPSNANSSMGFVNLRYTLPGAPPPAR